MLPMLPPMCLVLTAGIAELIQRIGQRNDLLRHMVWALVTIPIAAVVVINTPLVINEEKAAEESLAVAARNQIEKGQNLVLWDVSAGEVFVYHARAQVNFIDKATDLTDLIKRAENQRFSLVMRTGRIDQLPPGIRYRVIRQVRLQGRDGLALLELS